MDTNNVPKLLEERMHLMEETLSNKKGNRVPVITIGTSWRYYNAGYTPKDGLENPEINMEIHRKFHDDYYMDSVLCIRTSDMFSPHGREILGGGIRTYNSYGLMEVKPDSITVMEEDEYPELIADPYKFILEKVLPRRYALMRRTDEKKFGDMMEVMKDFTDLRARAARENCIAPDEYGVPFLTNYAYFNPLDNVFDYLRDFKEMAKDIRRRPEQVRDAGLALVEFTRAAIANAKPVLGQGIMVALHLPTFIKAKDFEKVYWPSFIKMSRELSNKGLKGVYAFEKSIAHLYDYLGDLPDGSTGILDEDTPWDSKKAIPNIGVIGGMPNHILYYKTKQECIDYAKMVIDNMAPYGGFSFCVTRQMLTPADGKAENFKAVNEFVHEYGVY